MAEPHPDFEPQVVKAMLKWPDVPDCYGWLSLDRRGRWRLRDEVISHARAVAFLNRHYTSTRDGRWYVQNGPQRVFVDLAYTPYVCREAGSGRLVTHVDRPVTEVRGVIVDENHDLVLVTEWGPAVLDDRDLLSFTAALALPDGTASGEEMLALLLEGVPADRREPPTRLRWHGALPEFVRLRASELPARYGYVPHPRPHATDRGEGADPAAREPPGPG